MPSKTETQIWRRIEEEGLADALANGRECWSRFHTITAYKLRLAREPAASLSDLLAECGLPQAARYADEREASLLLWHATERRHVRNILTFGFFHHRGVFFAPPTFGLPFCLAAGISAEAKRSQDDVVVFGCLFDPDLYEADLDFRPGTSEYRFYRRVPPAVAALVFTHRAMDVIGETVKDEATTTPGRFERRGREWHIPGRNPWYFPGGRRFSTPDEWLSCYLPFLFGRHRELTLFEVLNGVYANVSPMAALPPERVVPVLAARCRRSRRLGRTWLFELTDAD